MTTARLRLTAAALAAALLALLATTAAPATAHTRSCAHAPYGAVLHQHYDTGVRYVSLGSYYAARVGHVHQQAVQEVRFVAGVGYRWTTLRRQGVACNGMH